MKKNIPPTDINETFSPNKTKTENLAVIQREKILIIIIQLIDMNKIEIIIIMIMIIIKKRKIKKK